MLAPCPTLLLSLTFIALQCCYDYHPACLCGKDIREINAHLNRDVAPEPKWRQRTDPASKRV